MGWLVDRFGARRMNAWGISLWSTAAMLTGFVAGLPAMLAIRLVLGAGESTSWPACGKIVRSWFPAKERGIAAAFYQAGGSCGAAIAMPIVAWLVVATGWQLSFIITGAIGFVWLACWLKIYREPEECTWLSEEEKTYILNNRTSAGQVHAAASHQTKSKVARLLSQKTMWGIAVSQGTMVYTQYLILTWLPSYLMQVKQMDIKSASYFSAGAFLFATVFALIMGRVSDMCMTATRLAQGGRRNAVVLFVVLSAVIGCVTLVDNHFLIFLFVGLALAFTTTSLSLNLALTNDLIKDSSVTGTAIGIQVLGGNIFGLAAPIITGFIAEFTGSFDSGFYLAGVLLCLGGFMSFALARKPIE